MIKVVLVDDETLVKVGLKSLVDWKKLGFEIVAEGSNGDNGLALIKQHDPQLVITDIVMPKMDGIEMMRLAKEHNPNIQVIVLSSYNEFELVRKAMKLGAWDYILKLNISGESMKEVLEKVREVILSTDEKKSEVARESYDYWSLSAIRQVFLKSIIENVLEDRASINDKLPLMDFGLNENSLRLALLETNLCNLKDKYSQEQDMKLMDYTLTDLLTDIGNEFFTNYILKWSFGQYVMVFSGDDEENEAVLKERIDTMFYTIIEMIKKYVNLDVVIGISDKCMGYNNLPRAFEQAAASLEGMFYSGYGSILHFTEEVSKPNEFADDFSFDLKDELPKLFMHSDISGINNIFTRINSDMSSKKIEKSKIYEMCAQLLLFCDIHLNDVWKKISRANEEYYKIDVINSLRTQEEISIWLNEFRAAIIQGLNEQNKDEKHVLVTRAKKHIEENCIGPVNLKNVADYLNISAGYLSGLFPKYAGVSFTEYVNTVKVKTAQQLIKQGSHKIYEISYMLGFDNACYFSKVFKKIAGCTPTEYQQSNIV